MSEISWTGSRGPARSTAGERQGANLADLLERILDKGIVIVGDVRVNLLDIELLTIKLRLLVASDLATTAFSFLAAVALLSDLAVFACGLAAGLAAALDAGFASVAAGAWASAGVPPLTATSDAPATAPAMTSRFRRDKPSIGVDLHGSFTGG